MATTDALPTAPRRLPPPCWSPEETVALIDAYKDKWYSLRRGNLRGNHWQEVADDVASRCPVHPAKTSVQCRHKMEKLRKRYRAEIQRSSSGARRSASSWPHFQNMHSMEKGTDPTPPPSSDEDTKTNSVKRINDLYNRHTNGSTPGVRIKIPGAAAANPNPRIIPNSNSRSVVEAIEALGEGFMRMEKMKMEMAQQMEEMRMEMELKRTEMILDSQHRIVDAFARAIKKPKNHHYA